jgi:aldehyde:ferredoxin oxidoreductase
MPRGYAGKLLRIDLTKGKFKEEPLEEGFMKNFLGGSGFGIKILYDELAPGIDPMGPENKLMILTGPLTGTLFPCSGRWGAVTKSPLTGVFADTHSGGMFGPELKYAGFDGLIFEGRAEKPVWLWIDNGKYELRDAKDLWGKDTFTTDRMIKEELGDETVKAIYIGPAGEKLSKLACIMDALYRAAGRAGVGTVMGTKNLKAIAVRGEMPIEAADPDKFEEACWAAHEHCKAAPISGTGLPTYGTNVLTGVINASGLYPTRNFRDSGVIEGYENITGETLRDTILVKNRACRFCAIRCGRYSAVWSGPYAGIVGEGPEYETVWSFGGQTGVTRLDAIMAANQLCNQYGLDTIGTGNIIGWAMELYERGIITKKDTGGIDLRFGNDAAMVEMVKKIAFREGFGDILADGWVDAAKKIGKGSDRLIMAVKGMGLPAYDPRGAFGHGLAYATSTRGGCHLKAYLIAPEILGYPVKLDPHTPEGKARVVIDFQHVFAILDSGDVCKFTSFFPETANLEDIAAVLTPLTGWKFTAADVAKIGERIYVLEYCFNAREYHLQGKTVREMDTLPERLLKEGMPVGPAQGKVVPLETMLDEYYKLRGFDVKTGTPKPEKLRELGLDKAAEDMAEILK